MQFPSAPPPENQDHPIKVGEESFTIFIRKPTFAQLAEDEDRQMKSEGLRIHRLKSCVHGWSGLTDNGQDVPFSIYKLFALADADPTVLGQVNDLVDPLFDLGCKPVYLQAATLQPSTGIADAFRDLPGLIADAVKAALTTNAPVAAPAAPKPAPKPAAAKPAAKPAPVEETEEQPQEESEAA